MSWTASSSPREDLLDPGHRYGLILVEESQPPARGRARMRRETSGSLVPLSASDVAISVGVGAVMLAYVGILGLCVRWLTHWLLSS